MAQLRLLLRGLRWRRGLTLAVLAVATVTTTAAALGPLYARAAAESLLQDRLIQAGTGTGIRLAADVNVNSPAAWTKLEQRVHAVGYVRGYDHTIAGLYTSDRLYLYVPHPLLGKVSGTLLWRQDICGHVVVVAGRCPRAPNEVMASQRTIASGYFAMRLGTRVVPSAYYTGDQPTTGPINTPHPVTLVGEYRPRSLSDPFWFGQDYFDVRTTNPDATPRIDPFIVTRSEFISIGGDNVVEADFDRYLTPSKIRLADVADERGRVREVLARNNSLYTLDASTDLFPPWTTPRTITG